MFASDELFYNSRIAAFLDNLLVLCTYLFHRSSANTPVRTINWTAIRIIDLTRILEVEVELEQP